MLEYAVSHGEHGRDFDTSNGPLRRQSQDIRKAYQVRILCPGIGKAVHSAHSSGQVILTAGEEPFGCIQRSSRLHHRRFGRPLIPSPAIAAALAAGDLFQHPESRLRIPPAHIQTVQV